jgi:hypothetical protein
MGSTLHLPSAFVDVPELRARLTETFSAVAFNVRTDPRITSSAFFKELYSSLGLSADSWAVQRPVLAQYDVALAAASAKHLLEELERQEADQVAREAVAAELAVAAHASAARVLAPKPVGLPDMSTVDRGELVMYAAYNTKDSYVKLFGSQATLFVPHDTATMAKSIFTHDTVSGIRITKRLMVAHHLATNFSVQSDLTSIVRTTLAPPVRDSAARSTLYTIDNLIARGLIPSMAELLCGMEPSRFRISSELTKYARCTDVVYDDPDFAEDIVAAVDQFEVFFSRHDDKARGGDSVARDIRPTEAQDVHSVRVTWDIAARRVNEDLDAQIRRLQPSLACRPFHQTDPLIHAMQVMSVAVVIRDEIANIRRLEEREDAHGTVRARAYGLGHRVFPSSLVVPAAGKSDGVKRVAGYTRSVGGARAVKLRRTEDPEVATAAAEEPSASAAPVHATASQAAPSRRNPRHCYHSTGQKLGPCRFDKCSFTHNFEGSLARKEGE